MQSQSSQCDILFIIYYFWLVVIGISPWSRAQNCMYTIASIIDANVRRDVGSVMIMLQSKSSALALSSMSCALQINQSIKKQNQLRFSHGLFFADRDGGAATEAGLGLVRPTTYSTKLVSE